MCYYFFLLAFDVEDDEDDLVLLEEGTGVLVEGTGGGFVRFTGLGTSDNSSVISRNKDSKVHGTSGSYNILKGTNVLTKQLSFKPSFDKQKKTKKDRERDREK